MTLNWMQRIEQQSPRRNALICAAGTLNYGDVRTHSSRIRTLLANRGISQGQRVMLCLQDERHLLTWLLACLSSGITAMVLDPELPAETMRQMIGHYHPDDVVVDLAKSTDVPPPCYGIEPEPAAQEGALFKRLLGRSSNQAKGFFASLASIESDANPAVASDFAALIFFTSGSTSTPKAVELSHRAVSAHLETLARQHGYHSESRLLNPLPWHHADGLIQGPLVALSVGASLYRPLPFQTQNVPRFLDLLYSESITHLIAVPTMLALLTRLGIKQAESFQTSSFSHVISTAGYLPLDLWQTFESQFSVKVANTYGLTETVAGGLFCGPTAQTRKVGTLGKPVDCVVRIIDAQGHDVLPGVCGELLMQGDNLMTGYFANPEATAAVLRDGWLHTGDLVWCDDEGFIHFKGRAKNVILSGGHTIYPEEIDDVLSQHAEIVAVATLGLPHPEWEEIVATAIVTRTRLQEEEVLDFCRHYLPAYKLPRRILFLDALPLGPSGKVRLDVLRETFGMDLHAETGRTEQRPAEIAPRIIQLARTIFRVRDLPLNENSSPENTPGWDSLAHMELVTAIEAEFNIRLNEHDIMAITHLGAAIATVAQAQRRG